MERLITQDIIDLQTKVVEAESKTLFYMKQLFEYSSSVKRKSKTLYTATDITREFLDIKPCELNLILEKSGLIAKSCDRWFATGISKCQNYVHVEFFHHESGRLIERYKWTNKGRAYIMTILLEVGYGIKG